MTITESWIQKTPTGDLYIECTENGVSRLNFGSPKDAIDQGINTDIAFKLDAYFQDANNSLGDLPIDLDGVTPFRRQVIELMRDILRGEVWTYGELANKLGRPKGARAVGQAVGSNPVPIISPCHRVVASDGTIGGYSGGLDNKRWLLEHEGVPQRPGGWVTRAERTMAS